MWKKGKFLERLRGDVVDESVSLTTVLRKAKVLASALENEPFQNWVDSELNGYVGKEDLPEYRILYTQSFGTFIGPFAKTDNQVIPVSYLPEILKEFATVINLRNPVKELEGMSRPAQEMYKRRWPAEAVILAQDHIELSGNMVLVDAWQPIPPHVVEGVLDTIRNRLLEFVLRLEKVDPDILDSPGAGSRIPEERVTQLFNITINGDQNVLASGEDIHQVVRQHTISAGESDLMDQLQKLGVGQEDLDNLRTALAEDGERPKKELGPRVRTWLGRMTEKAVTGAWKVTVETAPQIVVKALSQYYGWS